MKRQDLDGEEGKFFLLVETVDFFSNTVILEQIHIWVRAEFWNIMLKRKKIMVPCPCKAWAMIDFTICRNYFF